ncbi:MAG: MFS transporter [Anaerolineaceae bacterium]|nr:MFS transporter [Anaerolineaceae bacterium]
MNIKSLKYKRATAVAYGSMFFEGGLNAIIIALLLLLSQRFGQDRAAISMLVAVKALGTFLTTFLSGRLSDRFGRKIIIFVGLFFFFAFILGMLSTHNYSVAMLFCFIGGLGHGLMDAPAMSILIDAYRGKTGPAMSFVQVFFTGGGMVTSILASFLIARNLPYQYLFYFFLIVGILLAFLIQITIYPPLSKENDSRSKEIVYEVMPHFLREGLLLGVMTMTSSFSSAILHTWIPSFASLSKGFSEASSVAVLTVLQVGSVIGSLFFASILRRKHATQVMRLTPIFGILAMLGLLYANSHLSTQVAVFFLGFVMGNFFSLCINMAGELFAANTGAAVGAIGSIAMLSSTVMVSISGLFFRSKGINSVMLIALLTLSSLALIANLFRLRYKQLKPSLK